LWLQRITNGSIEMFPAACSLAAGNKSACATEEHSNSAEVFGLFRKERGRFQFSSRSIRCSSTIPFLKAEKVLTDLKADRTLELKFPEFSLHTFQLSVKEEYSVISETNVKIVLPFWTTYLYEMRSSTPTEIKILNTKLMKKCLPNAELNCRTL
jgi:hypothetical protein